MGKKKKIKKREKTENREHALPSAAPTPKALDDVPSDAILPRSGGFPAVQPFRHLLRAEKTASANYNSNVLCSKSLSSAGRMRPGKDFC
jgi:hypothetical protein